jgi:hypothetical protein
VPTHQEEFLPKSEAVPWLAVDDTQAFLARELNVRSA